MCECVYVCVCVREREREREREKVYVCVYGGGDIPACRMEEPERDNIGGRGS